VIRAILKASGNVPDFNDILNSLVSGGVRVSKHFSRNQKGIMSAPDVFGGDEVIIRLTSLSVTGRKIVSDFCSFGQVVL
jgi:hypothetical protein